MPGGSQQRKKEAAIAALLRGLSYEEVAEEAGISERTLRNWLHDAAFRTDYVAARRQMIEAAIGELQSLMSLAVKTLRENLDADKASDSTRAALGILDRALHGAELLDLQEQVNELHTIVETLRK
jgi:transcriptional regulator with XRE-family HTH domain